MTAPTLPLPAAKTLALLAALMLVAAATLSPPRAARADGELSLTILSVDDSDFPHVRVVLTVDEAGRPLDEIAPDEIAVTEAGLPASVRSIDPAANTSVPLALILAIDTSGSVEGATLTQAQAAATSLLESLAPGDRGAVLTFASEVEVTQGLTLDRAAATAALQGLEAGGNTALYDAVNTAADLAEEAQLPRRAVVLLTDGEDFGAASNVSREESLAAAERSPALFYTVGVGPTVDRAYLEELAQRTSGGYFHAEGASDVPAIYAALDQRLRSQFVLEFDSTAQADARDRMLRIEVTRGSASGLVVASYTSLRPPLTAPPTPLATAVATAAVPVESPLASPPPQAESGGSSPLAIIVAGVLAALLLVAGLFLIRRRRLAGRIRIEDDLPETAPAAMEPAAAQPRITLQIHLPDGDRAVEIAGRPVTIGSDPSCEIRLPASSDVAPQHARLWVRDGRAMLHHLARGYRTVAGGEPIEWASLRPYDEIRIGPVALTCTTELTSNTSPPAEQGCPR